jgi:3-deoxy-D-manno-octulosonic-acid transferase
MLSYAYRTLTDLGAPFIGLYLLKRRAEGREDKARFSERLGHASRSRPSGKLVWCHAASVGEAASILALIEKLRTLYPHLRLLVTTGTVTSARMLEKRLPQKVIHQYVPVDRARYVARFLDHWKPDFALLIESELWPNMLNALRRRMIPAALVNGRMSDKSFRRWYRFKDWAKELLGAFVICLAQTEDDRGRLVALGAKPVRCFGNLKYAASPLSADTAELARLRAEIGVRPVWLLASSHHGEEGLACAAHKKLRDMRPGLLTIIVPRHAVRGNEVAEIIGQHGLAGARRSKKESITSQTDVYLADTMGELGLFYRLCRVALIGGSFTGAGGHNPVEAAQLDCAIIFGPHMYNFSAMAREFIRERAAVQLRHADEIPATVHRMLGVPGERRNYAASARRLADDKRHVLDEVLKALAPWLDAAAKKAA